jgi:hypothetical protein
MAQEADAQKTEGRPHRRTYILDRRFQLKYTFLMMGTGLVIATVFGLWIWQAHRQQREILEAVQLLRADPRILEVLEAADRQLLYVFLGIACLMAAALGLVGVLLTHRVAGPVFVMGHYLSVLAQGRFPRMRTLRNRDELKNFFQLFIQAVNKLKEREARHAQDLEGVVREMQKVVSRVPDLAPSMEILTSAARERRLALSADDAEPTPFYQPVPGGTRNTEH